MAPTVRKIIYTPDAPNEAGLFSQGVMMDNVLYVSGQVGLIPGTRKFIGDDITTQTEQTLKNVGAILKAAGMDFSNVAKVTVMLSDMALYAGMNEEYGKHFSDKLPARVACSAVGLPLGALVEIECVAYL